MVKRTTTKDNKPGDYEMTTFAEASRDMVTNETDKSEAVPRCIAQLTKTTGVTITDYNVYPSGFTMKVPCRRGAFRLCEACTLVTRITSIHISQFDVKDDTWLVIVDY